MSGCTGESARVIAGGESEILPDRNQGDYGDYKLIESLSLAAIAAGADGLIIEVHDDPENAWSDGAQSLKPKRYAKLVKKGKAIAKVVGREL